MISAPWSYLIEMVFVVSVGFLYAWALGLINPIFDGKRLASLLKHLPAQIFRNPDDWRTPARGGWRKIQLGDVCEDETGKLYTVKYIGKRGPKEHPYLSFGCMSVDHSDGSITAHYESGRDNRFEKKKRDLVRIIPRSKFNDNYNGL